VFKFGKGPKARGTSRPPSGGPPLGGLPVGEIVGAMRHLLGMVQHTAEYEGADDVWLRTARRLGIGLDRVRGVTDLEAMCIGIRELVLPVELFEDAKKRDAKQALSVTVQSAIPLARALGEGADGGMRRLAERLAEPDGEDVVLAHLPAEFERLTDGVLWLRQMAEIMRRSTAELITAIEPLAEHAPGAKKRLERIRQGISDAEAIDELERLRDVLLVETSALVEEAQARSEQVGEVVEHVQLARTHVKVLEYALADARAMAEHDALTRLGNRRALDAMVDAQAKKPGLVGVLALDLDHFKRINDAHGHEVGDAVLRGLGRLLEAELRGDDRAFRVGGEEFLAVLPGTDLDGAFRTAERIVARVRRDEFAVGSTRIPVSVSIGVSVWGAGDDFKAASLEADEALYEAKRSGRDRVVRKG